jgi:hypothetical protein
MTDVALIKLLLLSFSMVGVLRLFVVAFVGDCQAGPAIGRILRRLNAASEIDAEERQDGCDRPRAAH